MVTRDLTARPDHALDHRARRGHADRLPARVSAHRAHVDAATRGAAAPAGAASRPICAASGNRRGRSPARHVARPCRGRDRPGAGDRCGSRGAGRAVDGRLHRVRVLASPSVRDSRAGARRHARRGGRGGRARTPRGAAGGRGPRGDRRRRRTRCCPGCSAPPPTWPTRTSRSRCGAGRSRPRPTASSTRWRRSAPAPTAAPRWPTIDCPTLVIVGEEDTLTPPALSRVIADGIEGATLVAGAARRTSVERRTARRLQRRADEWLARRLASIDAVPATRIPTVPDPDSRIRSHSLTSDTVTRAMFHRMFRPAALVLAGGVLLWPHVPNDVRRPAVGDAHRRRHARRPRPRPRHLRARRSRVLPGAAQRARAPRCVHQQPGRAGGLVRALVEARAGGVLAQCLQRDRAAHGDQRLSDQGHVVAVPVQQHPARRRGLHANPPDRRTPDLARRHREAGAADLRRSAHVLRARTRLPRRRAPAQ